MNNTSNRRVFGFTSATFCICALLITVTELPSARAHSRSDDTLHSLNHKLKRHPGEPDLYIDRSVIHRHKGRLKEAFKDLRRAEQLFPGNPEVSYQLALTAIASADNGAAFKALDEAIARGASEAKVFWTRGQLHERANNMDAALTDYEATLARADNVEAFLARGRLQVQSGKNDEALNGYMRALNRTSNATTIAVAAFDLAMKLHKPPAAIRAIDPIIAKARIKTTWLLRRADALSATGDHRRAHTDRLAALRDAERLVAKRQTTTALLNRARALIALGRNTEAHRDLTRASSQSPHNGEVAELMMKLQPAKGAK